MTDQTTTPPEPPIGSRVVHPGLGVYRRFEDGRWRVEDDTMTWFGLTRDESLETLDPAEESAPAPVVREVPASEPREGDELWQMTAARDVLASLLRDEMATTLKLSSELERLRPVSPLPDQPGAVIRAQIAGSAWRVIAELNGDDGRWHATDGRNYWPADVTSAEVLYVPPAAAGVSEGGKA